MSSLVKNLLIALALAVFLWIGYAVFIQKDKEELVSESDPTSSVAAQESQEFLTRLQLLRTVDVEGTIFSEPRFRSLVDYRQDIPSEPVGRRNPFAPL